MLSVGYENHWRDGYNYLILDNDTEKSFFPNTHFIARFATASDAGAALRYLNGLPMDDAERNRAIIALAKYDELKREKLAKKKKKS